MVLLLISYGTGQRYVTGRERSIPKSEPSILRMNCNVIGPDGGRLREIPYLTLQFDRGGGHSETQRFEFEFRRCRVEARGQVVRKGFHITVQNAPVSIGKAAVVTLSNCRGIDFEL